MRKKPYNLKKVNHYLDKRKEIMEIISFRAEDVLGEVNSTDSISQEQKNKLNNFLAKIL